MYRPNPMADVLRTGVSVRQQEVHIERPDGSRGVALVDIEAVKDRDGNIIGAVNCFQDITEHVSQRDHSIRRQPEGTDRAPTMVLHELTTNAVKYV
jgi:PAS fold